MPELVLRSGLVVHFDEVDTFLVQSHRWRAHREGLSIYALGYPLGEKAAGPKRMHRLVINAPDGVQVDHRDNNGLNNRRANLRLCNYSQNAANRHNLPTNTSGYKGVTYHKRARRWQAAIKMHGRNYYLGLFSDPERAALAYNAAALELHGEFARVNLLPGAAP